MNAVKGYYEMNPAELLAVMRPADSYLDRGLIEFCREHVPPGTAMVEVGSFAGASSRIFADAIGATGRLICVDLWAGDWAPFDIVEALFDEFAACYPFVEKWKRSSQDASKRIARNSMDVVYIDANHGYKHVRRDIANWLPKIKRGGIIAGHDYGKGHGDGEMFPGVAQAVDEAFGIIRARIYEDTTWAVRIE